MESIMSILKIAAYVISGWTALAIIIDTLDVVFSRDITSIGWYASHPLSIWKLGIGMNVFIGMLVWLVAIIITVLTATFLL